ncbi:MAG: hypothetical protein JW894_04670 [Bacteroidales bacterium]|nr:hypothetical protein [Bacteroidales bacterium]
MTRIDLRMNHAKIKITSGSFIFEAELCKSTTAEVIIENLPFKGKATLWGEEIYFSIPVFIEEENTSRVILDPGEIGYWPAGQAFCIFFGPTPVSKGKESRAYSAVNVFGKISGDLSNLKNIKAGSDITVTLIQKQ